MTDAELAAFVGKLRTLLTDWGAEGAEMARNALAKQVNLTPAQRAHVEAQVFAGGATIGDLHIGDAAHRDFLKGQTEVSGTLHGAAVGVNDGTIQLFFGAQPPADAKPMLDGYLGALCQRYGPLALGRLITKNHDGNECPTTPTLSLREVYTALATDVRLPRERFTLSPKELDQALAAADPDRQPTDRLRFPVVDLDHPHELAAMLDHDQPTKGDRSLGTLYTQLCRTLPRPKGRDKEQDPPLTGQWYEPELAVESIAPARSRIVLLGDPGSGKSTVLRYLVVALAEALCAGHTVAPATLRGWAGQAIPIPIFCALGPVAKTLGDDPATDLDQLISAVLKSVIGPSALRGALRSTLLRTWHAGGVLLCFDGLDEVASTLEATQEGKLSRRERMADAIRRLGHEVGDARMVVTCRSRPYDMAAAWQLPAPWLTRRIEPFALGQVRYFVEAWYAQSYATTGAKFTPAEGKAKAAKLLEAIPRKPALHAICASPLLLTMVVLLHYNQTKLPDERAEVYEELVTLLLDRWEWVRSSEKEHAHLVTFGERMGLPHLRPDDLRAAIDAVAYEAHRTAQDGRGVIAKQLIYTLLEPRFRSLLNPSQPKLVKDGEWMTRAATFLELLAQESGLIQPDEDNNYILPHLTFQEYLAACHLATQEDVEAAHARWCEGGDRWREPLLLLMGRLRKQGKQRMAFDWLKLLLDPTIGKREKSCAQMQRDAVLAAACYREMGGRTYLLLRWHEQPVAAFEQSLRQALGSILANPAAESLLPLRIEAGTALGQLGDPRFPVAIAQWQAEVAQRNEAFGQPAGYWCYVRGRSYQIGGWETDEQAAEVTIPAFWLARYPITVAQFAPFVAVGYGPEAERWWTPNGWQWKQRNKHTEPWGWNYARFNNTNQSVIGVTWYEATAYCAWLSEQLQPSGYVVRLPTEAEWEAAAAY
ncbi:NACHT domain-containing protein, partial [Candidatus Viridilinea mediisalina]